MTRTEPKNTYDQGESAILELVDGPKDSRFMMTAKTVARDRMLGRQATPLTRQNIKKVTQFRGEEDLENMVQRFMALETGESAPVAQEKIGAAKEGTTRVAANAATETAKTPEAPQPTR